MWHINLPPFQAVNGLLQMAKHSLNCLAICPCSLFELEPYSTQMLQTFIAQWTP